MADQPSIHNALYWCLPIDHSKAVNRQASAINSVTLLMFSLHSNASNEIPVDDLLGETSANVGFAYFARKDEVASVQQFSQSTSLMFNTVIPLVGLGRLTMSKE